MRLSFDLELRNTFEIPSVFLRLSFVQPSIDLRIGVQPRPNDSRQCFGLLSPRLQGRGWHVIVVLAPRFILLGEYIFAVELAAWGDSDDPNSLCQLVNPL